MDYSNAVSVLLVGARAQFFSLCQKHLERNGCQCDFAKYEREVWEVLEHKQFDLVLGVHNSRGTSTESLGVLLTGSRTTLFLALPVEEGCWWVPIFRSGQACFGAPALRPNEFTKALDEVLKEIRDDATSRRRTSMQTA